ncbi:MAG: hypothetical protein ABFC77_15655 [Thermoguttaceae bacterium]|jgi:hypothetical protein
MTAKITADATGTKVTIGTAAEDALQIDATAKTIVAVSPYQMLGSGPAFRARMNVSGAPIPSNPTYLTPEFDTASAFNPTTGYFQPNVAGYYQLNASWVGQTGGAASRLELSFQTVTESNIGQSIIVIPAVTSEFSGPSTSAVIYLNGTTDKVRVFIASSNAGANVTLGRGEFSGALVRAA